MVEGLFVAFRLVVVHSLEGVVSGRANHQLLEDVREVDLYFVRSQVVEDRLILVGVVLEEVHADLLVAHQQLAFFEPMLQFLTKLPTLRHRQYWTKYYRKKIRIEKYDDTYSGSLYKTFNEFFKVLRTSVKAFLLSVILCGSPRAAERP